MPYLIEDAQYESQNHKPECRLFNGGGIGLSSGRKKAVHISFTPSIFPQCFVTEKKTHAPFACVESRQGWMDWRSHRSTRRSWVRGGTKSPGSTSLALASNPLSGKEKGDVTSMNFTEKPIKPHKKKDPNYFDSKFFRSSYRLRGCFLVVLYDGRIKYLHTYMHPRLEKNEKNMKSSCSDLFLINLIKKRSNLSLRSKSERQRIQYDKLEALFYA